MEDLRIRLNKMWKENALLKEILKKVTEGMKQLKSKREVSGPFSLGMITQEGYQSLNP